jgi:uracil-DNA glycosylase
MIVKEGDEMDSWKDFFEIEKKQPYYQNIISYLNQRSLEVTIYPKPEDVLNAYKLTPLDKVKVVILGQDPYHNPNEAHGLAFSVRKGILIPPSLRNIFIELESDVGVKIPDSGDLTPWAQEGVMLLNTILTVEHNNPLSHKDIGWQILTDHTIEWINSHLDYVVFILWGNQARSKKQLITNSTHYIIEGVHPSPLSVYRGFFGSKPFSKTNDFLKQQNKNEINWKVISYEKQHN